ncbi:MAG: Gfo/Idh/MocA family oxidoreductase [Planctomycetota bacterium]
MSVARPIGYGVVGAGAFARFCAEQYRQVPGLRQVAVADIDPQAAQRFAQDTGVPAEASVDALLANPSVELVHLTTPPSTHYALALRAIVAGKHVLCEKPLALTEREAQEVAHAADQRGVRLGVNLIMRYNPLCAGVEAVLDRGLLGDPLYASFQNLAKDEPLGPDHWFWNTDASGGIFIEHGVHFFDVFEGWLERFGAGRVVSAQHGVRPGAHPVVEQARATARYGPSVLADFMHSFTQASAMDRQSWRIVCERGDLRLDGWTPMTIEADFLAEESGAEAVTSCFGGARLERVQTFAPDSEEAPTRARFKPLSTTGRYALRAEALGGQDKPAVYGHMLAELMSDLLAGIRDPSHRPKVTGANGVASVAMAEAARRLAETIDPGQAPA